MTRTLAFIAAVLLTSLTVSTSCFAAPTKDIRFTLEQSRDADRVELALRSGRGGRDNTMNTTIRGSQLGGLDRSRLRAGGPLSFALVRDAGRLDCAGTARSGRADGRCRFAPDQRFANLLASYGMARPSVEQSYAMTLVGVRRDLLDVLRAASYPMPGIEDYIALSAVGVTPAYIAELARAGYRPSRVSNLIQFKAVGVTPEYLGSLARAGYARLPADQVVQLAALDIDPEFIRGFERIGYRSLPVSTLVQLKALNVTPEFVLALRRSIRGEVSPQRAVQLKAIGFDGSFPPVS